MKTLVEVKPTSEQLKIVLAPDDGPVIIRGAAGSGKTTTAILRLKKLASTWIARKERLQQAEAVKILILTYNRTLKAYVEELALKQLGGYDQSAFDFKVCTFAKWARDIVPQQTLIGDDLRDQKLRELSSGIPLPFNFILEEVEYVNGRLLPNQLESYLEMTRIGRGSSPRVPRQIREQILTEVLYEYGRWKEEVGLADWNDHATEIALNSPSDKYDIVIVDECQDFSANQVRAINSSLQKVHSLTLILDAAQRIYPRGFAWREVNIDASARSFRLSRNERNTRQIARLAKSFIQGLHIDDDGTLPDFDSCRKNGDIPNVLIGKFSDQLRWVESNVLNNLNDSFVFLHPKGWFKFVKRFLSEKGFEFVEITRTDVWPQSDANIALSTLHSVKGLEFDHVIILGLNQEVTPHGSDRDDSTLDNLRRLLAMGIGRARKTVTLGYKQSDASTLISYLDQDSYRSIRV